MTKLNVEGSCVFEDGKFVHVQSNVLLEDLIKDDTVSIPNYEENNTGRTYQRPRLCMKVKSIGQEILDKEAVVFQPLVFNVRKKPVVKTGVASMLRKT